MYETKTIGCGTPYCMSQHKKYNFGLVYCLKCVIVVARFHLLLLSTWSISHAHAHTQCVVIERMHCFTDTQTCIKQCVCARTVHCVCLFVVVTCARYVITIFPALFCFVVYLLRRSPFCVQTKEKRSIGFSLVLFLCRIFIIHNALLWLSMC